MRRIFRIVQEALARFLGRGSADKPRFLQFSSKEQIVFVRRLASYLAAGIPIVEALMLLADDASSRSSAYIYRSLARDVSEGRTLSHAMRAFSRHVREFTLSMIETGEQSGTLRHALTTIATTLRKQRLLQRKLVGALLYPAIIMIATVGISSFLMLYAFPKIVPLFRGFSTSLPFATRMLIGFSDGLARYGPWAGIALLLLVSAFLIAIRRPRIRHFFDMAVLRMPVAGPMLRQYHLSNVSRTLSTLLESGTPIALALEMTSVSSGNSAYRHSIAHTRERVLAGDSFSDSLRGHGYCFPRTYAQMTGTGERTGSLAPALAMLADHHEEEFDAANNSLSALIEPVLMIVMGLLVGFIALAIITPVYQLTQDMHV